MDPMLTFSTLLGTLQINPRVASDLWSKTNLYYDPLEDVLYDFPQSNTSSIGHVMYIGCDDTK